MRSLAFANAIAPNTYTSRGFHNLDLLGKKDILHNLDRSKVINPFFGRRCRGRVKCYPGKVTRFLASRPTFVIVFLGLSSRMGKPGMNNLGSLQLSVMNIFMS